MKENKKTKIVSASIVVLLIATLTSGGYLCFLKGKNSVHTEGLRTATFCNDTTSWSEPRLALDMRDVEDYEGYLTFAFYNVDENGHIDVYGKIKQINNYCAVLDDQNGERFGFLTVIDDIAVLAADSGETYQLKYFQYGTFIDPDFSGWYEAYGTYVWND